MDEYKKYEPIFGSWYLSRMIGKGSFGKVFEITREEFGTTYRSALKIITIPQDDDDLKTRMTEGTDVETVSEYYEGILKEIINENEIMSQLKGNSNIVSYEDHQIIPHGDGIGYDILIRMELLTPLLDRMVEKRLDEKEVVKLGIDMCRALELCHKKNIIHRDIKPQNIFISDNGDFKLGDFGIARTMEKTTGGMSKKGTYKYMAPEVFRGDHYDSTVDIYSLGIVLYSLLNGNRGPFLPPPPAKVTHNDEEEARMRRFRGEPIPAPRDASPMLAYIIQKACSAYPGQRYHTAEQMRRDLESYLQNYGQAAAIMGETASEKTVLDESIRAYTGSYNAGQLRQTGSYYPPQGSGQYPPQPTQPVSSGGNGSSKKIIAIAAAAILLVVIIGAAAIVHILGGNDSADESISEDAAEISENSGGDSTEVTIPAGAEEYEGHHYMVFNDPMSWTQAKIKCEDMGGHLATVTTADEQDFIEYLLESNGNQKYHYWLGATDEDKEGKWYWLTGEKVPKNNEDGFSNWEDGQPKNNKGNDAEHGEDYMEIQTTRPSDNPNEYMKWNDICESGTAAGINKEAPWFYSQEYYGYICEWEY